jgi:hypothetical protein
MSNDNLVTGLSLAGNVLQLGVAQQLRDELAAVRKDQQTDKQATRAAMALAKSEREAKEHAVSSLNTERENSYNLKNQRDSAELGRAAAELDRDAYKAANALLQEELTDTRSQANQELAALRAQVAALTAAAAAGPRSE